MIHFLFLSFPRKRESAFALLLAVALTAHAQNLPAGTRSADSELQATPLAQAENSIAGHHPERAKEQLAAITAKDPKNARALYDLGFVNESLGDKAAAEASYRAAIAADDKSFEAHAALGMLLIDKDCAAAIAELKTATTLTPAANAASAKADVLRTLAHLYADKQPEDARDALLAAIQLTGETPEDTRLTAYIAGAMGDAKDAEAIYRRLLQNAPNDPETVYSLSAILIAQQQLDEAETILLAALEAHPEYTPNNAQLARVYMLRKEPEKAVPLLEREHAKRPQDASVTLMLADLYSRTGDALKASMLYQQMLAAKPDDIALLIGYGDSLIRQKRFGTGMEALEKADRLFVADPAKLPVTDDRVQLTGSLAFAASENHEYQLVLTALDQRVQYAPDTAPTLFLRATAHDHLQHVALARQFYTQFLAAAGSSYPDESWEAKHRLLALPKK